jgi:HAD superfamily hydrolase (TIGR01490 family)
MRVALFDLDHTLLPIDSADAWSHFLARAAGLDSETLAARIRAFGEAYRNGGFDTEAYLAFQMGLLARVERAQLEAWRSRFMDLHVRPHVRREALDLIDAHRRDGDLLALATGTNAFVTAPIAAAFGLPHLIAVRPEERDGRFTGRYVGGHTYGAGKLRAVEAFLAERGTSFERLQSVAFYTDSVNDLPLLERVAACGGRAVVTNGDERLRRLAQARGWPTLELFEPMARFGDTVPAQ